VDKSTEVIDGGAGGSKAGSETFLRGAARSLYERLGIELITMVRVSTIADSFLLTLISLDKKGFDQE
jgi:hypothetical protein